jgi:hypothetical protein
LGFGNWSKGKVDMDREAIMKEFNRILDLHGVNLLDRESLLDDLYEVVSDAHYDGYCDGRDNPWRNERKPTC